MGKDLVALYQAVLRQSQMALGLPDLATTRSRLYTLLLRKPLDPALARVLDDLQVSASYVRTHLLSIGSWPTDIQRAIQKGLPYQDARRLAKLDEETRRHVLGQFVSSRSEFRSVDPVRAQERQIEHERLARGLGVDAFGWTVPNDKVGRRSYTIEAVSTFRSTEVATGFEALPRRALQGLIGQYTTVGQRVVDPMAGSGTTAVAAHAMGRWAWSGDIQPRYEFIHHVDAADTSSFRNALGSNSRDIDLVVLHPPSMEHWLAQGSGAHSETANYKAWLSSLVSNGCGFTREGGHVAVIVLPYRKPLDTHLVTDGVARDVVRANASVVGYHVLVDAATTVDWHIVVGRVNP